MRRIPLTQGRFTLVSNEVFRWAHKLNWSLQKATNGRCYAVRGHSPNRVYLHRAIVGAPKGVQVDHKNGNGLFNLKRNLRLATPSNNGAAFRTLKKNKASRFRGVTWRKNRSRWLASIRLNGLFIYLGQFQKETDAARAYDEAAIKLFGEFAQPNF